MYKLSKDYDELYELEWFKLECKDCGLEWVMP